MANYFRFFKGGEVTQTLDKSDLPQRDLVAVYGAIDVALVKPYVPNDVGRWTLKLAPSSGSLSEGRISSPH